MIIGERYFFELLKFLFQTGSFIVILILSTNCSGDKPSESFETRWQFHSQRPEIAPAHWVDDDVLYDGQATLVLSGDGKDYSNGCWSLEVEVTPDSIYEFRTNYRQTEIDEPNRCILARIVWLGKDGERNAQPEYPRTLQEQTSGGWNVIQQCYKVPENVVATVYHRPENTKSSQENLNEFARYIKIASEKQADIVCLPEAVTLVGTGKTYNEVSEPVPGPSTEFLGEAARENHIYIVAGIIEREGPAIYNTAVLLDRDGNLAGKYRKVALPREEIEGGVTPGNFFPVFDTDFGRIGMMVCWDLQFPEVARMLTLQGAEVIFMPIWGGNLILARARAIENQIYLVSSSYGMKTGMFNLEGKLVAEATDESPVAVVTVDLNKQMLWPWLGDLKNRIPREIPGSKMIAY
jgi:predicted amidohydrolase